VKKTNAVLNIVIIILIFTFGAFCFYFGVFFEKFGANQCYSGAISQIEQISTEAIRKTDPAYKERYLAFIKTLPIRGYETDCNSVKIALDNFIQNEKIFPQ
jgi:hypothetical protein